VFVFELALLMLARTRQGIPFWHGSPDHFPLRLRRRLGGSTVRTVLVIYAAGAVLGGIGLLVMVLNPMATIAVTALVGALVLGALVWLARVPMES
jgi:UDP-GlcNAc:undecaprenyl-phosphate GlcNAc-1-phosphate transferase